jgi:hypothetical protein
MDNTIVFDLSPEQVEKYQEWKKAKKDSLPQTAIGGAFTLCFTPTGIGVFCYATCIDGTKIDLTEYDKL